MKIRDMTTQPTTPKRWLPRFSVRTLVILVTLVCCYAACWGPTKTRGVRDVEQRLFGITQAEIHIWGTEVYATMPLVVEVDFEDFSTSHYQPIANLPRPSRQLFSLLG